MVKYLKWKLINLVYICLKHVYNTLIFVLFSFNALFNYLLNLKFNTNKNKIEKLRE